MNYLDRFNYQITGNPGGHKLVFLHGLMGSGLNWRRIAQAFEAEYQVLAFDQRGHGRSFHPESGYHPRDYAGDLAQILDALGWTRVALVGHSMGGRNALEFADLHPDRLWALVLEDITPGGNPEGVSRLERLVEAVPTPFASREAARDFFANDYVPLISWYPDAAVIARFLHSNVEPKPDGTYDWRFARRAIFASLREGRAEERWDTVARLTMPTLVMRGENSVDFPRADFERVRRENPRLRTVEVAGAAHWVHFDQPIPFINSVKAFLLTCLPHSVY